MAIIEVLELLSEVVLPKVEVVVEETTGLDVNYATGQIILQKSATIQPTLIMFLPAIFNLIKITSRLQTNPISL